MTPAVRRARGFALILALFLIVSLAVVGAYLLTVSNVQVESGVMDEQGARAYQAARAGLEWGAYQVLQNPAGAFVTTTCVAGPPPFPVQNVPLPNIGGSFRAHVQCQAFGSETEGGNTVRTFRITSTGCNAGACPGAGVPGYVERQLQLTVAN